MTTRERARRIFAAWLDAADLGGPTVEQTAFDLYPDMECMECCEELWHAIELAEAMEQQTQGRMVAR